MGVCGLATISCSSNDRGPCLDAHSGCGRPIDGCVGAVQGCTRSQSAAKALPIPPATNSQSAVAGLPRGGQKRPSELLKLSSVSEERVNVFHFRDRDQNEVDFVLENAPGQIVGMEVKAAASVTRRDFSGLDRLASIAGDPSYRASCSTMEKATVVCG